MKLFIMQIYINRQSSGHSATLLEVRNWPSCDEWQLYITTLRYHVTRVRPGKQTIVRAKLIQDIL